MAPSASEKDLGTTKRCSQRGQAAWLTFNVRHMKFIAVIALLAVSLTSYAAELLHPNFRDGWDSFRFGLGVADTDNYSEQQIVIVHRHHNGADLIIDRYGKPLFRKSINDKQLAKLITDIQKLFVGSSYSHKVNPDKPLPQFSMILLTDTGLFRESFYKDVTSDKKAMEGFMQFVDSLSKSD